MRRYFSFLIGWLKDRVSLKAYTDNPRWARFRGMAPLTAINFLVFHLLCFGIIWVGWSPFAVWFAVIFYFLRMFAITGFYHRYFAHRSFQANRVFSAIFAALGSTALQRGPLWWAAIHRHHHRFADTPEDIHSPIHKGFFWSHYGWVVAYENKRTRTEFIKDWLKFPELVLIDKFGSVLPLIAAVLIFIIGHLLSIYRPDLGTNGPQLFIWGFVVSTVACSNATFSINSIDHLFGTRRYNNPDTSRNNFLMAILTLGEGWHNNHHHFPITAKAGFYWWEIDITYYILVLLSWLRIVKNLRPLPRDVREQNQIGKTAPS